MVKSTNYGKLYNSWNFPLKKVKDDSSQQKKRLILCVYKDNLRSDTYQNAQHTISFHEKFIT